WVAAEDAARYCAALGLPLPALPPAFLKPTGNPLRDLIARYARTRGPFRLADAAARFGLSAVPVGDGLQDLEVSGRVLQGEFRPGETGRECCDANVLRTIRQRTLAKLRHQIEPLEPPAFARFLPAWHGIGGEHPENPGTEELLEVIRRIQG